MTDVVSTSGAAAEPRTQARGVYRTASRLVAALFVTTTLAGMVDAYVVAPLLNGATRVDPAWGMRLVLGAFCMLYMAIGVVGIAATLYPVLRPHGETVAITYVAFRTVEGLLLAAGPVGYLVLVAPALGLDQGAHGAAIAWVVATKVTAFQVAMVVLGVGSTLMCLQLGRAGLVPRWLARWGVLGYVCLLTSALLALAGVEGLVTEMLYVVGGVWELVVFPAWLLRRGLPAMTTGERAVARHNVHVDGSRGA